MNVCDGFIFCLIMGTRLTEMSIDDLDIDVLEGDEGGIDAENVLPAFFVILFFYRLPSLWLHPFNNKSKNNSPNSSKN